MKSHLLSTLLAELDLRDEAGFVKAHPHPWLVREPTAWHPTIPGSTGRTLLAPAAIAALADGSPLAIALEAASRDASEVTLGRSPASDLCIDEGTVSQQHLAFAPGPEGWTVRDVGSTNGSWLDGERLEKDAVHPVRDGTRIQAAQVLFTFATSSGLWRRLEAEALRL